MQRIKDGIRYDTEKAIRIADDEFTSSPFQAQNHFRNSYLYMTEKGRYFVVTQTSWQGERDSLAPLDAEEARHLYENMRNQHVPYEEAFPGAEIMEA